MKADCHLHTAFSCDSNATMEEYIHEAENREVDYICFTEHVDFNKNDYGCGYYSASDFFKAFNAAKKSVSENLSICAGLEFSEPHLYPKELAALSELDYDFIIGSVHWIGDMFPSAETRSRYSCREFFHMYFSEVLKAVKAGGFDCLGHIDFPKRYYNEIVFDRDMVQEIFSEMKKKGIVLEINTSSLRKGLDETMPGLEILQLYKDCGGQYITIGSDAHDAADLCADNEQAKQLIRQSGLQEVIFLKRQMQIIS